MATGTPNWCEYYELRDANSHPSGNSDVYNRPNRTIWDNFCAEHEKNGDHNDDVESSDFEEGTYVGNSVDDRDISLTDSSIDISFMRVFSSQVANNYWKSSDMAGDTTKSSAAGVFAADMIQDISTTGQFQVGTNAATNQNAVTYYYVVYGN
jgi:hypothetical protein